MHKLSEAEFDKKKKEAIVWQGLAHAERAVTLKPDCGPAHKWCGIFLSSASAYEGPTAQITTSFTIAEHFEQAIALSPNDATARHMLGVWCFEIAKLSWIEKKAAAALFATPPKATFAQAYGHFLAAEEMDPGFYPKNMLMLARTCQKEGRREEAAEWRDRCLQCEALTPEDVETIKEARKFKP